MNGYSTTLENQQNTPLPPEFVTPSKATNRLITLCVKVARGNSDPRALGIVLDEYTRELVKARDHFKKKTYNTAPGAGNQNFITGVLEAFQDFLNVLSDLRSWFVNHAKYSLASAPEDIYYAYSGLHASIMAYEWDYLCQGESPHPAMNLISKVIAAVKKNLMTDQRFGEILDNLWEHFSNGLAAFEADSSFERRTRGEDAVHMVMDGIEEMDQFFESRDTSVLDSGIVKFNEGCMLYVELMQDSTGEALADKPTPSPQVNWVIHAARAVLEGLDASILERAQNWFEPQLSESYFRFEQCANQAAASSPRMAEQVGVARDGFDRLNRALPLLRLGLTRHSLLYKAMQHLEDGAELISGAWQVFTNFEDQEQTVRCLRCGAENPAYSKVCNSCGARIVVPESYQDETEKGSSAEPDTSDHLSRLIEACDAAKSGRMSKEEFNSITVWGRQLLRSACASLSNLPSSSGDPSVQRALESLRHGVEELKQGLDEMQWWIDTSANHHLSLAADILLQAYANFSEVQELAADAAAAPDPNVG